MTKQIPISNNVPKKVQIGEEYSRKLAAMERNLACPKKIDRYATHESGHLLFLLRRDFLGSPWDEEAVYQGPTIFRKDGSIGYFMAAVSSSRISLFDESLVYTRPLLEKLADVGVAGNVLELEKSVADEETEMARNGDRETFLKHCYKARTRNGITFEGFSMWTDAHGAVKTEIQKHPFSETSINSVRQAVR